jgi:hypothetical protein
MSLGKVILIETFLMSVLTPDFDSDPGGALGWSLLPCSAARTNEPAELLSSQLHPRRASREHGDTALAHPAGRAPPSNEALRPNVVGLLDRGVRSVRERGHVGASGLEPPPRGVVTRTLWSAAASGLDGWSCVEWSGG